MKLSIILGSLLLVGCAVTPHYHPTIVCAPAHDQKILVCMDAEKVLDADKDGVDKDRPGKVR